MEFNVLADRFNFDFQSADHVKCLGLGLRPPDIKTKKSVIYVIYVVNYTLCNLRLKNVLFTP